MNSNSLCRLCSGEQKYLFSKKLLNKYHVDYFKCSECNSLQTEYPYWVEEAYQKNNLSTLDTGAMQRNLHNFSACIALLKLLKINNLLDYGGGDGVLCRLLRDYSINCYLKDSYAFPAYAQGFDIPDFDEPELITSFEVLEHLVEPAVDLDKLFNYSSKYLLVTTEIYSNQDHNWWYLAPLSGQHIFFYSGKSLDYIAARYGYQYVVSGGFIFFYRNLSVIKLWLVKFLLRGRICRLIRGVMMLLPAKGVWDDFISQSNIGKQ